MIPNLLKVRTLRQFLESGQTINCDCSNYWVCTHSGPLKLDLAIQRLGWEFDFYTEREALSRRVYCSICGWRNPTFRLGWAAAHADSYTGKHGAGIEPMSVLALKDHKSVPFKWIEPSDWQRGGETVRKFGPRR